MGLLCATQLLCALHCRVQEPTLCYTSCNDDTRGYFVLQSVLCCVFQFILHVVFQVVPKFLLQSALHFELWGLVAHGYKEANLAFVRSQCTHQSSARNPLFPSGKENPFGHCGFIHPLWPQKSSQWEAWRAALGSQSGHSWQPRNQCPDVQYFRTTTTIMQSYKDMKYENTKIQKKSILVATATNVQIVDWRTRDGKTCEHSRKLGRGRDRIGRRGKNSFIHSN